MQKIRDFIVSAWLAVPENWRVNIVSIIHTFIASFLMTFGALITSTNGNWADEGLKAAVASIFLAALRAATKSTINYVVSFFTNGKNPDLRS